MGALAWEQEPPKTHSVSRPFFDRGVGSSILASLSEAGGNDQHSSLSKPLPPRSRTCDSRLSERVRIFLWMHAAGQCSARCRSQKRPYFCSGSTDSWLITRFATPSQVQFGREALPPRESLRPSLHFPSGHRANYNKSILALIMTSLYFPSVSGSRTGTRHSEVPSH